MLGSRLSLNRLGDPGLSNYGCGVVMYAAPPNQVSEETPPREGDRIGRCRCRVKLAHSTTPALLSVFPPKAEIGGRFIGILIGMAACGRT
jgi:hypothetical protein